MRQAQRKPLVAALRICLEAGLARISGKSVTATAIRYGLEHGDGLVRFLGQDASSSSQCGRAIHQADCGRLQPG